MLRSCLLGWQDGPYCTSAPRHGVVDMLVQAWAAQKLEKHYIKRVFIMSESFDREANSSLIICNGTHVIKQLNAILPPPPN